MEIKLILEIIGAMVSVAGFIVIIIQLFRVDKSLKSSARGSIYDMASRIKEVFIEKPHLRPYFFENVEIGKNSEHYPEVLAITDYYCLYLEQISTQQHNIDKSERDSWRRYVQAIYNNSPIIKEYLMDKQKWYSPKFWDIIA